MSTTRFPTFSSHGWEQGGEQTPSGTRMIPDQDYPLPRLGHSHNEEIERAFRGAALAVNPARVAAFDALEKAQREHKAWESRCIELQAAISQATNRMRLAESANMNGIDGERRRELRTLQAEQADALAELEASAEEVQAARTRIESFLQTEE
jgi:hypothetical protein